MFFEKYYSQDITGTPGYIYTYGVFFGGRLENYKDDFKAAVESNNFINSFPNSIVPWSYEPPVMFY